MNALCLNGNNPEVKKFYSKYGKEKTYRIYVENNYLLPDFSTYTRTNSTVSHTEALQLLQEMIDTSQFTFTDLAELEGLVPSGTEAAFWKNGFYFGKEITRGAVAEEAFHAIFQTLINPSQREELLETGKSLLKAELALTSGKSIKEHLQEMKRIAPETYNRLSIDEGYNRLYEEALAKEFVNYYNSDNWKSDVYNRLKPYLGSKLSGVIQKLVDWLYRKLSMITKNYVRNQELASVWFEKIARGDYKYAKIVSPETYYDVPTTRLISLGDSKYKSLSAGESAQVIRNIGAAVLQLKNELGLEELDTQQRIDAAIQAYQEYYLSTDNEKFWALAEMLVPEDDFGDPVEEYKKIREDVVSYVESLQVFEDLQDELLEDEVGSDFANYDKEANEKGGFESSSAFIKQYIATVGVAKGSVEVTVAGKLISVPVYEIADPSRVYYGLARGLGNTKSETKRLQKLFAYGDIDGNDATRALVYRLLSDITPPIYRVNNTVPEEYRETAQELTPDEFKSYLEELGETELAQKAHTFYSKQKEAPYNPSNPYSLSASSEYIKELIQNGDMDKLNAELPATSKLYLIRFLKSFDLWVRDNMTLLTDPDNQLNELVMANRFRPEITQIDQWSTAWQQLPKDENGKVNWDQEDTRTIEYAVGPVKAELDPVAHLKRYTARIKQGFDKIGIQLAPGYLQYITMLEWIKDGDYTEAQLRAYDTIGTLLDFNLDKNDIATSNDLIVVLQQAARGEDLYAEGEKVGALARLKRIARGNAKFDETVFESNYKNAENKTIYAHQNKTFHLDFFSWFQQELDEESQLYKAYTGEGSLLRVNSDGSRQYLKEDNSFYRGNRILNKLFGSKEWKGLAAQFKHFSVDGVRLQEMEDKGKFKTAKKNGRKENGLTFGGLSPKELGLFIFNSQIVQQKQVGNEVFTPVFMGNLEASKTADFVFAPYLKELITDDLKLSPKALELLKAEIKLEYDRITRVYQDIQNGVTTRYSKYNTGKKLNPVTIGEQVLNLPANRNDYRGLQFTDSIRDLLPEALSDVVTNPAEDNLAVKAMQGIPFESLDLDAVLQSHIRNLLKVQVEELKSYGVFDFEGDSPVIMLDKGFLTGDKNLGFKPAGVYQDGKFTFSDKGKLALTQNLYNTLLSYYLNVQSLNQIAHGDPALLYKNDGSDMFKRFKGRNGANQSFYTNLTAPEWGIDEPLTHFSAVVIKEPKAKSDIDQSDTDLADAQNYTSVLGMRKALFAQGKLDRTIAKILDAVEAGKPVTVKQIQVLADSGVMFNPLKTVGFDGKKYWKKCDFMLSRELTSYPVAISPEEYYQHVDINTGKLKQGATADVTSYIENGKRVYKLWKPRIERKILHDKRLALEGWRNGVYQGAGAKIDLIMPESATKMLTVNILDASNGYEGLSDQNVVSMDLNYYGLQTENPSGKEKITDPTQMLEIIMNEIDDTLQIPLDGKTVTGKELKERFQQSLYDRDFINYKIAWNTFVKEQTGNELVVDLDLFKQKFYQSLLSTKSDKQSVDFANPENGFNLNLPLIKDKVVASYFSHFTREVLSAKRAGDAKAHVSSYGFKGIKKLKRDGKYITWEYIGVNHPEYAKAQQLNPVDLSGLQFKHTFDKNNNLLQESEWYKKAEELLASGTEYIIDELRHLKPRIEEGKVTGYFSESLMPSWIKDGKLVPINKDSKYMYGTRIPSQDKHSSLNLEWVDALPAYLGSAVATVKEVVQLSGSDFDIDKLYTSKPEMYWNGDEYVLYGSGDAYYEWKKYLFTYNKNISLAYKKLLKDRNIPYTLNPDDSVKELYIRTQNDVLDRFNLPSSESEFIKQGGKTLNPGYINNQLLFAQQAAWGNNQTINDTYKDGSGGQTNTPASMDVFKDDLMKYKVNGKPLFGKTRTKLPLHFPGSHLRVHEGNTVGKALIGIGVNGNLFVIDANALKFKVEKPYLPMLQAKETIDGYYKAVSTDHNGNRIRVFDVISSIISADTDEAKEQINAFFNMSEEAQAAVIHGVALGYTLKDMLVLINLPVVQKYLKGLKDKDSKVLTKTQEHLKYKSIGNIAKEALGIPEDTTWEIPLISYSGDVLEDMLYRSKYDDLQPLSEQELKTRKDIENRVLYDFIQLTKVNEHANNFVRIIKLKKGFGAEFSAYDRIREAIKMINTDEFVPIKLGIALEANKALAKQYKAFIDTIIPEQVKLQEQVFINRTATFTSLKNALTSEMKKLNAEENESVDKTIESFLFTKLYKQWVTESNTQFSDNPALLYTQFSGETVSKKFKSFGAKYGSDPMIKNNPIFSKIKPKEENGVDTLQFNSITKMKPEEQESLIDGFISLINFRDGDQPVGKELAWDLFNYYILKDGWHFRLNTISKIFSTSLFKGLSGKLDEFMQNPDMLGKRDDLINELRYLVLTDVNHIEKLLRIQKESEVLIEASPEDNWIVLMGDIVTTPSIVRYNNRIFERISETERGVLYLQTVPSGNTLVNPTGMEKVYSPEAKQQINELYIAAPEKYKLYYEATYQGKRYELPVDNQSGTETITFETINQSPVTASDKNLEHEHFQTLETIQGNFDNTEYKAYHRNYNYSIDSEFAFYEEFTNKTLKGIEQDIEKYFNELKKQTPAAEPVEKQIPEASVLAEQTNDDFKNCAK